MTQESPKHNLMSALYCQADHEQGHERQDGAQREAGRGVDDGHQKEDEDGDKARGDGVIEEDALDSYVVNDGLRHLPVHRDHTLNNMQ